MLHEVKLKEAKEIVAKTCGLTQGILNLIVNCPPVERMMNWNEDHQGVA